MTKAKREREEGIKTLKTYLKEGDTVFTILRHVSKSGMYRAIDVFTFKDNEPYRLTGSVAKALGYRYDKNHDALGVNGCGMDMGFHVAYQIGHLLFPDRKEQSGYSLKHRWL